MTTKKTFIVLILICFITNLHAQVQKENRWRFGLKAGVNVSTITDLETPNVDFNIKPHTGVNLGIITEYKLTEKLYFTPSLNLSVKGVNFSAVMGGDTIPIITPTDTTYRINPIAKIKEKQKLAYLELPILFAYRITCSSNCILDIMAGPYFAVGLYGKYSLKDTRYPSVEQARGDVFSSEMYSSRLDAGIMGGIQVELYKHFRAGINYGHGLTALRKSIDQNEVKPKNRTWSFSIGYIF